MFKLVAPAAALSLFFCSTAWAVPISPIAATTTTQLGAVEIIPVQIREGGRHHNRQLRNGQRYNQQFTPGKRYRSAPQGYRRHGSRPGDWRSRGCVTVGPVWFCP